jgi:hypothetical protein
MTYLYRIDWSKNHLENLHKMRGNMSSSMNQSSLINVSEEDNNNTLYNCYSSPVENCVTTIAINQQI